jgi:hypothetical protein
MRKYFANIVVLVVKKVHYICMKKITINRLTLRKLEKLSN